MKKSPEQTLAEWVDSKKNLVGHSTIMQAKFTKRLTHEDIFGELDESEKKEVMLDKDLFERWVESVYNSKELRKIDNFLKG